MSGGVSDEVLTQGWHIISPTKKVTEYSIALEQSYLTKADKGDSDKNESFNVPTSDGKMLNVDVEFSYKFDANNITTTFNTFRGQDGDTIKDTFIKPKISAWTQEITAKYPVTDVFGDKRAELNAELDTYLKEKFMPYGIIIDTVNFTRIDTDEETAAAIQKKVTAQQELELAQIEAETAQVQANKDKEVAMIEAEKNRATAEIQAEQKKIEAQGKAEALLIEAEAEAEANKVVAESLTDRLIEQQKISKWKGDVPAVQGADAATIIDVGNVIE
jgi:regulator of protease activity HflC (stomatin/prohibitin superfamily)